MKVYGKESNKQYIMTKNILDFERFTNDKIDEGLITTYPIFKTVSNIQNTLHIDDSVIDIMYPGKKDEYIIVDREQDEELLNKIDHMLDSCGYEKTYTDDEVFCYDKKFTDDIFDEMKSLGIKYLYHITPSVNDKKIAAQGLVPKNKSKKYTYPARIYLLPDTEVKENEYFFKSFCRHLYSMNDDYVNNERGTRKIVEYSVYRIDFSKLHNIQIFESTNSKSYKGYYTRDNIRPEFLEKIYNLKIY